MSAEAVDAYLRQARALLGTGMPAAPAPRLSPSLAPSAPGSWNGTASEAAEQPAELLDRHRGQLSDAHTRAIQALDAGAGIADDAHRGLDRIESAWNSDKAALAPFADTPEGQAALNRAGIQRINETQSLVFDVSTRFGDTAAEVAAAAASLPPSGALPGQAPGTADALSAEDEPPSDALDERTDESKPTGHDDPWAQPAEDLHNAGSSALQSGAGAAGLPASGLGSALGAMPTGLPSMGSGGLPMGGGAGLSSLLQPIADAATASSDYLGDESDADEDTTAAGQKVVRTAERALGLPYVWGGGGTAGPSGGGFDCSGLTQWAVAQATDGRVQLPRTTYDQIAVGRAVDPSDARIGDLVFSNFSAPGVPEHVQIYAGSGTVIEAQQTGVPVKYSSAPTGDIAVRRVL